MEGYSREDERCPQLLDLISKDGKWLTKSAEETRDGLSEERKLELRLGPPGEHWTVSRERKHDSLSSFAYLSSPPWQHQTPKVPSFLVPVRKESSQACNNRGEELQSAEKKKAAATAAPANTAVHNSCSAQKRTAPASVVGWPPIRSFRKNLANGSTSSKLASDSPEKSSPKPSVNCERSPFVKINMDGVPIGRKVDLKAYDSYEKLSLAVDELFRGLLAAQSDSCGGGIKDKDDGGKEIGGLLDGSGEYTLVYEDNEGDRMLVGDVPWNMFVSTVKRLRVLKSSELPMLSREDKHGKLRVNA
ncbi:hypothetical protein ACS0TY_036053 [Phlomoides rotata]